MYQNLFLAKILFRILVSLFAINSLDERDEKQIFTLVYYLLRDESFTRVVAIKRLKLNKNYTSKKKKHNCQLCHRYFSRY